MTHPNAINENDETLSNPEKVLLHTGLNNMFEAGQRIMMDGVNNPVEADRYLMGVFSKDESVRGIRLLPFGLAVGAGVAKTQDGTRYFQE